MNLSLFQKRNILSERKLICRQNILSNDGENFVKIHEVDVQKKGKKVVKTSFRLYPKETRYLKVIFENYGTIPNGRQGDGNPAWLFVTGKP